VTDANEPHGVVVVDKPQGLTSFDVVAAARRHFGTRRVGHAGTLDPMATGVLLLLLGEATKLADVLSGAYKTYEAEVAFGRATDTLDAEGRTVREQPCVDVTLAALRLALDRELERDRQEPPQHSALKVRGQRAYALARAGQHVSLAERDVHVDVLELLAHDARSVRVRLRVSKGYYVRSFARDVCATLGIAGHLSALRRTESGGFEASEACRWPPHELPLPLSLAAAARRALPAATLTEQGVVRARHGKALAKEHFLEPPATGESPCAWFDAAGALVALGGAAEDGFRVRRGFTNS
jgi:tRNA pseudouridine55 synthase